MIKCFFDGACEPINPGGTAAYGAVIIKDGHRIWEQSKIFYPKKGCEKETSNNLAKYSGFKAILDYLLASGLQLEPIEILGDSNLLIQQMFGRWKIRSGYYVPIALACRDLLKQFPQIRGQWIPREENSIADELSKAQLVKARVKFRIQST
jgi:ribonuclease HI